MTRIIRALCLSSLSFRLSDESDGLLRLGHVPLSRTNVVGRHARIVVLHASRSVGKIPCDIIHRSVRRAQLFHLVLDARGKAD